MVTRDLGGASSSAGDARRFVGSTLTGWGLAELTGDAQLMVSELVSNAVRHAQTGAAVTVAVADGTLEIGVTDGSTVLPRPPGSRQGVNGRLAESGRGLHLVNLLADAWGTALLDAGKQVWFRLAVDDEWPHRTDCPCGGDDLDRLRLDSGLYAVPVPGPWAGGRL